MEHLFVLGTYLCELTFAYCFWGGGTESCVYPPGCGLWQNPYLCQSLAVSFMWCPIAGEWCFAFVADFSFTSYISWFSFTLLIFVKVESLAMQNAQSSSLPLKKACISAFCNTFIFLPRASYHWSFRQPGTSCLERKRLKGVMMNVHKHIKACPWKRRGTNYPH